MKPEALAKGPPTDEASEKAVLGSCLLSPAAMGHIADWLQTEHFSPLQPSNGIIFQAMRDCFDAGVPTDLRMVANRLREMGVLEQVGGVAYLSDLPKYVPNPRNVVHYAKTVTDKAVLRGVIEAAHDIIRIATAEGEIEEVVLRAEERLLQATNFKTRRDFKPISDYYEQAIDQIEQQQAGMEEVTGLPSGFQYFDQLTGGLQKSDLIIIGARPGMGKTTLATCIGCNAANRSKVVGLFSLEMDGLQVAQRIIAAASGVNMLKLRTGSLRTGPYEQVDELAHVIRVGEQIKAMPLFIDDTPGIRMAQIRTRAARLRANMGRLDLIIVDYAQLIGYPTKAGENRTQALTDISKQLKEMARELQVPVIVLAQLSRETEKRQTKLPELSDLGETSAFEKDADIVGLLYRDEYYNPQDTERPGVADLIIKKHRNGPTGVLSFRFDKETTSFHDLTDKEMEDLHSLAID